MFGGFRIEEVTTRYSADVKATRRVGELLISRQGTWAMTWLTPRAQL